MVIQALIPLLGMAMKSLIPAALGTMAKGALVSGGSAVASKLMGSAGGGGSSAPITGGGGGFTSSPPIGGGGNTGGGLFSIANVGKAIKGLSNVFGEKDEATGEKPRQFGGGAGTGFSGSAGVASPNLLGISQPTSVSSLLANSVRRGRRF